MNYDQTAMGLPLIKFALFLIANFGKLWVSRRNIGDVSATFSGIKRVSNVKKSSMVYHFSKSELDSLNL
jgi:hypothetical protein